VISKGKTSSVDQRREAVVITGFMMKSIKGEKTKIVLGKGQILPLQQIHDSILKMRRDRVLDIRQLNGGSLRPLTWYHLFLDWNGGPLRFIITTDVKWRSFRSGKNFRRIGSLHTTTKRTIRKFRQCGNAFTWAPEKEGD
jgi:hypothetical protein